MDSYTKAKIRDIIQNYLKGDETSLITLSEINKEYLELFPLIKDATDQIIEGKRAEIEKNYNEQLEELKKDCGEDNSILLTRLNKMKKIWGDLNKNKKDLSDLMNE